MTKPSIDVEAIMANIAAHRERIAGLTLAPCPFCGRPDGQLTKTLDLWYVLCEFDCNAAGPTGATPEHAAALWNAAKANAVVAAAQAWQQAIANLDGVHAAEQVLLAALKDETINPRG